MLKNWMGIFFYIGRASGQVCPVMSSPAMQARDADRGTTSRLLVAVLVLAVSICPGSQFSPAENEIPDDNIVTNNK